MQKRANCTRLQIETSAQHVLYSVSVYRTSTRCIRALCGFAAVDVTQHLYRSSRCMLLMLLMLLMRVNKVIIPQQNSAIALHYFICTLCVCVYLCAWSNAIQSLSKFVRLQKALHVNRLNYKIDPWMWSDVAVPHMFSYSINSLTNRYRK